MKHILILLSFSLIFSQELEVEGDLKVTGNLEAATIDSLQHVIANLQAQIDSMHADNQLETRVYTIDFSFSPTESIQLNIVVKSVDVNRI